MILYDHPSSGNCMKARILLRQLELPFERVTVDLFRGETRSDEHFGRNPDGRIPVLELDSGDTIAESGAILTHLADGTAASVTVGENATAVAESVRLAASWVRESASDLVDGDPEVTVGEVRVRAEAD